MTMRGDDKDHSLTDNLWAELSVLAVVTVILIILAWGYVWYRLGEHATRPVSSARKAPRCSPGFARSAPSDQHRRATFRCNGRRAASSPRGASVRPSHLAADGGATAASVWPLALSALATKPEAFISSMNSRR